MAANADWYGSARVGLQSLDTGGDSEITVRGYAARMGFKGEHDLGNGMMSYGKYEWAVGTEGDSANVTRRHAYVGLKGDFGSVMVGQTYHTFYNFAYGPTDQPWWGAGYAVVLSPGRTAQALTYAGSAGAVSFGASLYMDDSSTDNTGAPNDMDKTELGVSFDAGVATFALAISDQDEIAGVDPESVTMITAHGIQAGPVDLAIGYQTQDVGNSTPTALIIHAGAMGGYLHFESLDSDGGASDPTSLTLGYTQSIGTKTTMWYEYQAYDADTGNSDDDEDYLRAVLKVDWD
ncbi:MAG: porin [Gammaproteobacteria bacterium]|nr:porin [Gammaproteobacteria bacterium]